MERGSRYKAYSQLRESKLRSKRLQFDEDERESKIPRSEFIPPVKKSVRFQESLPLPSSGRKQGCSVLAQSVPDFSLAARKENRRPPENQIPRAEKSLTPPPATARREKMYGSGVKDGGSKSANSVEKHSGGRFTNWGARVWSVQLIFGCLLLSFDSSVNQSSLLSFCDFCVLSQFFFGRFN